MVLFTWHNDQAASCLQINPHGGILWPTGESKQLPLRRSDNCQVSQSSPTTGILLSGENRHCPLILTFYTHRWLQSHFSSKDFFSQKTTTAQSEDSRWLWRVQPYMGYLPHSPCTKGHGTLHPRVSGRCTQGTGNAAPRRYSNHWVPFNLYWPPP